MKRLCSKIAIPGLIILAALIQSFTMDAGRVVSLHPLATAVVSTKDSIAVQSQDSIAKSLTDTVTALTKDSVEVEMADSTILTARDTIIVPDSLKITDPFKYKYYIATKDSLTREQVRDSLINAGDTLELMRLDSLYTLDSTTVATEKFNAWFASLSRREKKKYIYEQELPAKMARMDSILHRKDSIRAAKDSIIATTPRILETYAIPDSLHYKRMIAWNHNRYFNNVDIVKIDTTYNYHFHDYPYLKEDINATHLGTVGGPLQLYNWFKRTEEENVIFYSPYTLYTYSPETLPFYNTKTPYTELAYWGTLFANTEKEETNIKIMTTQNILPEWNVTLEYHRYGANGMLRREDTDNRTAMIATNYMGKRYLMHAGYVYNKIRKSENGGIVDNFWIRDTTVDSREIEIHLNKAGNVTKKNTVFLDQSYRIPFNFIKKIREKKEMKALLAQRDSLEAAGDSLGLVSFDEAMNRPKGDSPADSLDRNITTAFIGHSSEYSVFTKMYTDQIELDDVNGRNFYNDKFYIHPTQSADSMRVMRLENRIYLRLQPWADDAIVSKIDVGIGHKLLNYYDTAKENYLAKSSNTIQNSMYLYAGVEGQFKKYLKWDAFGRYTFLGAELNDFGVDASIAFSTYPFRKARKSPLTLKATFSTDLNEPDHYHQRFYSNHYRWENDFSKISTTKIGVALEIPRWKFRAAFGYSILNNNIYFDTEGLVRQNKGTMSVISASLMKNFTAWKFHFDHNILFQLPSNKEILPLPMVSVNLRYYFQFDVVKNVMQMQIGADGRYNTNWYAPAYNPVLGVFHNQKDERYGNGPLIDVFVNIQWKRACIFIKAVNLNMGWPNKSVDYFSGHHYINTQTAFKFGIYWPFYIQPKRNSSVTGNSNAATAGMGGGGVRSNRNGRY